MSSIDFYKSRKDTKDRTGKPLWYTLGLTQVKGDVGLEIEMEGNKFQKTELPTVWTYHKDGSLRGADNAEYVLGRPVAFSDVDYHLAELWKMFSRYGTKLDDSNRTSVHVHLNVQQFHLNRLTAFLGLYFSVEEILTEWCGDHRVGNLFCLRAKDAPAIINHIKRFLIKDGRERLPDNLHYSGLNAHALFKFGSIEIRTLRGVTKPGIISDWVKILRRIYDLSEQFPDPRDIPVLLSSEGPMAYLDLVLGDYSSLVRNGVSMNIDQLRDSLYEGVRLAQDLCYCRNWSEFVACQIKTDPFGRTKLEELQNQAIAIADTLASVPTPSFASPGTASALYQQVTNSWVPDPTWIPMGLVPVGSPEEDPENDSWLTVSPIEDEEDYDADDED